MKAYWQSSTFLAAAAVAISACAPDLPTDPGYHLFKGAGSHAVVSPDAYMAVAGCVPHAAPKDSSTIVFPLIGGGMARFDCRAPADSGVTAAIQSYRNAMLANGASETVAGEGETYQETYYSCDITNHYQYVPADDEYVYTYSEVDCTYWEVWSSGTGGGRGGGSGGDGNPQPVFEPLPLQTVSPDSACKGNADATPLIYQTSGVPEAQAALPGYGPLGSLAVQQAVLGLASDGLHPEAGGVILISSATHEYSFQSIPNLAAATDVCSYSTGKYVPPQGYYIAALAHGHPPDGTLLNHSNCSDADLSDNTSAGTGPSQMDFTTATLDAMYTNTNYVVQQQAGQSGLTITRYGTDAAGHQYTGSAWQQQGPNSCAAQ